MNVLGKNSVSKALRATLRFLIIVGMTGLMFFNAVVWIDLFRFLDRIPSGAMLMVFILVNVVIGIGLGRIIAARCFPNKNPVISWKWRVLGFIAVVIVAGFAIVFHPQVFSPVGDFLMTTDALQPADAVWILGTADERYAYGVDLYQQGFGKQLILTLGTRNVSLLFETDTIKTNVDAIRNYVLSRGVSESDLLMLEAESTYEEALRAKDYIKESGIQSVIIVSSPEHMRRVEMIFDHIVGNSAQLTMAAVPLTQSRFVRSWWTDRFSLGRVIYEYFSLGYYFFRYVLF